MKVPTLKKFLWCMSLVTGGYVVGWTCIVISAVEFLSGTKSFILNAARIVSVVPHDGSPFAKLAICVVISVLYVIYCGLAIYAAWQLIEGTKARDPQKMILIMVLFSSDVILSLVLLLALLMFWSIFGIIVTSIAAVLNSYFLLVVFSLFKKLKANVTAAQTQSTTQNQA